MSLLVRSIPSLIGGVSQQSPQVRNFDQLEAQINGWSDVARGLTKRAPTRHIKKLMATPGNAHVHTINRDTAEQYVVIIADGAIRVFETSTGAERLVRAPGGWAYLDGITDYQTEVSASTVADYTFVTNRTKVCTMAPLGTDTQADLDYQIWLSRRNGTDANGVEFGPGTAYQYDPNPVLGSLTGTVQRFDKLPETASEGAIYRIQTNGTSSTSPYYVRRTQGIWDECVKPGLVNAINPLTMPHALISEADGTFTFAPFSWAPRRVGDTDINPNPGFIGRTIRKVFFFQNRLSFLFDENCAMSVVGDFGNFWRMSQTDYLESDVIEMSATSTRVSLLKDAVTFNDGILLTSDQTQFSLSFGELGVTASSLAIRPTTNYTVNTRAGLAPLGSEIYFSVDGSESATIREYTRLAGSDATTAADITGHVDNYIPAGVSQIVPADDLSALFVLTDGAPHKVFVHQFRWTSADEKAQVAWHEWTLGDGVRIVSAAYLRGFLYLVIQRADGLYLESLNLKAGANTSATANQVYLDRQTVVTGVYSSVADRTEFTLPYVPDRPSFRLVRGDGFGGQRETLIDPSQYVWLDTNVVAVPGQHHQAACVGGANYSFEFEFSTQYVRNQRNEAITTGRTQLRRFSLSYTDTAYFKTIVRPHGLDATVEEIIPSRLSEFTGKVLGSASLKLNTPARHTGTYDFQIWGQNTTAIIRIVNDTHVASTFVSAEWEAQYHNRARSS